MKEDIQEVIIEEREEKSSSKEVRLKNDKDSDQSFARSLQHSIVVCLLAGLLLYGTF